MLEGTWLFKLRLNLYYQAGLLAFLGGVALRRWGHGALHDFAERALLGAAIILILAGMLRRSRFKIALLSISDWGIKPRRTERDAGKDQSWLFSALLCVICGLSICTNVTWSDLVCAKWINAWNGP